MQMNNNPGLQHKLSQQYDVWFTPHVYITMVTFEKNDLKSYFI